MHTTMSATTELGPGVATPGSLRIQASTKFNDLPGFSTEYPMALQATHEDENGRPGAATVRERLSQPWATAC